MGQFIDFPEDREDNGADVGNVDDTPDVEVSAEEGERMLREALESFNNPDYKEDQDSDDEEDEEQDTDSEESDTSDDEDEDEDEGEYVPNVDKSFKTPENAVNAERRRQAEQRKLDEYRQNLPEHQLLNQLAQERGISTDQLISEIQETMIAQQAARQGIPVEVAKQLQAANQRLQELENQTALREYQDWENRISSEASSLKSAYPFLNDADIDSAKDLLLNKWRNVEAPLEQAVFALHGKKILEQGQQSSRTETLAEVSGRKSKSGVPLNAGKPSDTQVLTEEERYIARQMGISEEVYLKNKR